MKQNYKSVRILMGTYQKLHREAFEEGIPLTQLIDRIYQEHSQTKNDKGTKDD